MIVSKSPLRVSFLGGTTDYPEYFKTNGKVGRTLGCTINQYVYVTVMDQPKFENSKFKFNWRVSESVNDYNEISHPVLRSLLSSREIDTPLNISTMANLPGRSGLGSSSAFTVAMIKAIEMHDGSGVKNKFETAMAAVNLERNILQEPGGYQDQFYASFGGFQYFTYDPNGISATEIFKKGDLRYQLLSNSMVLIATGGVRNSFFHARETIQNISRKTYEKHLDELAGITQTVSAEISKIEFPEILDTLSNSINESWKLKKVISNHKADLVDELLEFGFSKGALGGKLCGAGGSGFALFLIQPERKNHFLSNFKPTDIVNFQFTSKGVKVKRL